MVFCVSCQADVDLEYTDAGALSCCPQCGRVFEDIAFSNDLTFAKGADGEGEMVGQFVSATGQVRCWAEDAWRHAACSPALLHRAREPSCS
jgi:transcription factor IIIB subunit 2